MTTKTIKSKRLKNGCNIAIISPSWGGPSIFPKILDKAIENLKTYFDFNIIEYPTARMTNEKLYLNPKLRANDINNAFMDDKVDAIFVSIGGSDSIRILEYLDTEAILNNPKILMGFSDTTTILTYLNNLGLVTFHGPSMMAGWSQIHNYEGIIEYYKETLTTQTKDKNLPVFPSWSNGYPDWSVDDNVGKVNSLNKNTGMRWIQGTKNTQGRLWGGCIEVLDWINGTRFWPNEDFWNDRILFIETSENKPSPEQIAWWIRSYGVQGILQKIKGILIGIPKDYTESECVELDNKILNIVKNEFSLSNLPIISNINFGHTDPNLIMPLGINVLLDVNNKNIKIRENIFK